jgi:hypothetical protein
LLKTISGILAVAAAIRMDAGFKSPLQLIATLLAIEKDPPLALNHWIEPEARDMLWSCYQRAEEAPGKYWFDIERLENTPDPEPQQIISAALRAVTKLKCEVSRGRRPDKALEYLALKLKEIFLRYNDSITRHSVESSNGDGNFFQIEGGPFVAFLEEVLAPLNSFLKSLPQDCGAKPISAGAIVDYIRVRRHSSPEDPQQLGSVPHSPHIYHRELCCPVVFSRHIRNPWTRLENTNHRDLHGRIPPATP